jgi:hypothetical protein
MNKNIELLVMDVDAKTGRINELCGIRNENSQYLPIELSQLGSYGGAKSRLTDWWRNRIIPSSRIGINEALSKISCSDSDSLAVKSLGLNLSDQYWIRPNAEVKWENVNFFTNDFSEDIGNLLLSGRWTGGSLISPDSATNGIVRKMWKIIRGRRCLFKGSFQESFQTEPFREVFASKMLYKLLDGLEKRYHVLYGLLFNTSGLTRSVYSVCENFVTPDTEYVAFNQINASYKRPVRMSPFDFCASFYGSKKWVLEVMLILDYIVLNEDRHYGNFGIIRDVNSCEILGPAPIFDTGSSLFHDRVAINPKSLASMPFSSNFEKQLNFVDVKRYREQLIGLQWVYKDLFYQSFDGCFEDKSRIDRLCDIVGIQISKLLRIADSR